jgi:acyl carrier protein
VPLLLCAFIIPAGAELAEKASSRAEDSRASRLRSDDPARKGESASGEFRRTLSPRLLLQHPIGEMFFSGGRRRHQVRLMSKEEVAEEIKRFIVTNFCLADPASLIPATSFHEEGIVDSPGVLEVVSFLEETFKITIQDSEVLPENLDSLQALSSFVERKLPAAPHLRLLPEEAPSPSRTPPAASTASPASLAQPMAGAMAESE